MKKLGIFLSNPVHYQVPIYRLLTQQGIDARAYFYSRSGVDSYFDPQFKKNIRWDINLLDGYEYHFLKNYSIREGFSFFGFMNFDVLHVISQEKFDAILVSSWSYMTDWLVIFSALLTHTKILLRTESPLNQELLKSPWKRFIKKILFGKFLFPHIHAFLYIGRENKKFYRYYGVPQSKLFFAPYAVDNDRFMESATDLRSKRENLRKEIGIGEKDIAILFVGKLSEKKRPLDLLKAYEILIQQLANGKLPAQTTVNPEQLLAPCDLRLVLIFVGDGELRKSLEEYAERKKIPNVLFVGFKNQSEIAQYYTVADIFVLPSGMGETWGLVVNEAMCFRLPLVISDLVGCSVDLIRHGINGYTFPCEDVQRLVECLGNLVLNQQRREYFGEESSRFVQQYNYNICTETIIKILC